MCCVARVVGRFLPLKSFFNELLHVLVCKHLYLVERKQALFVKVLLLVHVVGFRTEIGDSLQCEIAKAILDREGVSPRDFYVRAIPELSSECTIRSASVKARPCFRVQSYATRILGEFMKADPLAY